MLTIIWESGHGVILKIVSNSGQIDLRGNIQGFQNLTRTNTGDLKKNRRLNGSSGQDDFFVRSDGSVDIRQTR